MVEYDKLFVKIPNNMVINEKGMESVTMRSESKLTLGIYCFLVRHRDLDGESRTSLEELICKLGYKPNSKQGRINDKVISAYEWLVENNYIEHLFGEYKKVSSLIVCKVYNVSKSYFELDFTIMDKLTNINDMLVYCAIKSRMSKKQVGLEFVDLCFPSFKIIEEDLGLSNKTITESLKRLREMNLVYYGNVGSISKNGEGKKIANNVYVLKECDLETALRYSANWHKENGYEILDKKSTNYKRKDKNVTEKEKKEIKGYILDNMFDEGIRKELIADVNMSLVEIVSCNNKRELEKIKWRLDKIIRKRKIRELA